MKKILKVFPRQQYTSAANGALVAYFHDPGLYDQLGAADEVLWEIVVYSATQNAKLTLTPHHNARPSFRPSAVLGGIALTASTLNNPITAGPVVLDSAGPFGGRLEGVLGVQAGTGTNQEGVDAEVNATLIFK